MTKENTGRMRQAARKPVTLPARILRLTLIISVMQFLYAQLVCWGLSLYHVHSGILGPWLIMEGISSLAIWTVTIGMMQAGSYFRNQ